MTSTTKQMRPNGRGRSVEVFLGHLGVPSFSIALMLRLIRSALTCPNHMDTFLDNQTDWFQPLQFSMMSLHFFFLSFDLNPCTSTKVLLALVLCDFSSSLLAPLLVKSHCRVSDSLSRDWYMEINLELERISSAKTNHPQPRMRGVSGRSARNLPSVSPRRFSSYRAQFGSSASNGMSEAHRELSLKLVLLWAASVPLVEVSYCLVLVP